MNSMSSQILGLNALFPLDHVKPIDLAAIARIGAPNSKATPVPAAHRRKVLDIFADFMKGQGLTPVLCELAIISDKMEWHPQPRHDRGRQFVSLINAYQGWISRGDRSRLVRAWTAAIRSLSGTPGNGTGCDPSQGKEQGNYIVLNDQVYDYFSHRIPLSINNLPNDPWKPIKGPQKPGTLALPVTDFFPLPANVERQASSDLANASIHMLLSRTLRTVPASLRNKLRDCMLVIIPFSRPFLDASDLTADLRAARANRTDGDLFSSYPERSSKDPGGCFFGLYYAAGLKKPEVSEAERRFYLQCQYLLTLSALVEARKNLLLYYESQTRRNYGYILHQVRNDLEMPRTLIENVARTVDEPHKSQLQMASNRIATTKEIAGLMVESAKAVQIEDSLVVHEVPISRIASELRKTFTEQTERLRVDYEIRSDGEDSCVIAMDEAHDAPNLLYKHLSRRMELCCPSDETFSVDWIGRYHRIICHEICVNLSKHGQSTDPAGLQIRGRWALVKKGKELGIYTENVVKHTDNDSLSRALALRYNKLEFRQSTGFGQMRLAIGTHPNLSEIMLEIKRAKDRNYYYLLWIPIGTLHEPGELGR